MREVPASVVTLARRQVGLVTRAQAAAAGLSPSVVDKLARRRWTTVLPGVYDIEARQPPWPVDVLAVAARLRWGTDVVISGRSAAHLLRIPVLDTPGAWNAAFKLPADPPAPALSLIVPPGRTPRAPGIRCERRIVAERDVVRTAVGTVTSPLRTATDLLSEAPLLTTVAAADGVTRGSRSALQQLEMEIADRATRRGAALARKRLPLVEPATESPLESMLRLLLHLGGLPPAVPQFEVRGSGASAASGTGGTTTGTTGRRLARVDFAYPDERLVLECDGREHHLSWSAGVRDRRRQNELVVEAGLRVLRFTYADLSSHPVDVVASVRAALAGAGSS